MQALIHLPQKEHARRYRKGNLDSLPHYQSRRYAGEKRDAEYGNLYRSGISPLCNRFETAQESSRAQLLKTIEPLLYSALGCGDASEGRSAEPRNSCASQRLEMIPGEGRLKVKRNLGPLANSKIFPT